VNSADGHALPNRMPFSFRCVQHDSMPQ
jgi:hypothetical protein